MTQRSRFWAQATYLAGLTHAQRGRLREERTSSARWPIPRPVDGSAAVQRRAVLRGARSRAARLGRIAHEEGRFDNARYYYYLVPRDSNRLAEALYEAATTRYEAKDYEGARELLDELRGVGAHHGYEDEAGVLDAYVDLAQCKFPDADRKLREFLTHYEPVRDAARRIQGDERAMASLLAETRGGAARDAGRSAEAGPSVTPETLGAIAALVRVDPAYGAVARKRAVIEREASGLRFASRQVAALSSQLATPAACAALDDRAAGGGDDRGKDVTDAIAGLRREIDALEAARVPPSASRCCAKSSPRSKRDRRHRAPRRWRARRCTGRDGARSPALLRGDAERAAELGPEIEKARGDIARAEAAYARDALHRLDLRLSRLLRRARLGRIESVLGKKRALEVEIEAIANGYLPNDAVDSLDAGRYLRDDEEYWPFEGDDWPDEYVGSEGLK
ncbi:MAG: hypothetical protein U0235_17085 [Polyangiaceae bacterium]